MISSIGSIQSNSFLSAMRQITQTQETMENNAATKLGTPEAVSPSKAPSFGEVLGELVEEVDSKQKVASVEVENVLTGHSDNIHQAMLSMQEAGVAFSLMKEVRNKLVSGYQELMRMQV